MGIDYRVEFAGTAPSREELATAIGKYLGEAGELLAHGRVVVLVGKPSHGIERRETGFKGRGFEVYYTDKAVTITTRQADEYTNGVAYCLQLHIARIFQGEPMPVG